MVLAPEHELVDALVADAVARRRRRRGGHSARRPRPRRSPPTARRSPRSPIWSVRRTRPRPACSSASYATNPANGQQVPIFIADYVLVGYGTGAIMAVPGHDQRDWEFATEFGLPIVEVVARRRCFAVRPYSGDGVLVNSGLPRTGMSVGEAKEAITERLEADGRGQARIEYKLRDWLFARQRYWGEPFPIVYDADGRAHAAARIGAAGGAAGHPGLLAGAVRPRRRRQRAVAAVGQGDRLGARRTGSRRRTAAPTPATPT